MGTWRGVAALLAIAGCHQYVSHAHVTLGHARRITAVEDRDGNCARQAPPAGLESLACRDDQEKTVDWGRTGALIWLAAGLVAVSVALAADGVPPIGGVHK
jgi:hypothetical protein